MVITRPVRAVPVATGAAAWTGAASATVAVAIEYATTDASGLVAVTLMRSLAPTSAWVRT